MIIFRQATVFWIEKTVLPERLGAFGKELQIMVPRRYRGLQHGIGIGRRRPRLLDQMLPQFISHA
jgi:hypothetical protein